MNWYYYKITRIDIPKFWKEFDLISVWVLFLTIVGYYTSIYLWSDIKFLFISKIVGYTILYILLLYIVCMNSEEKAKSDGRFEKVGV